MGMKAGLKLVCGVGYNSGKYPATVDGKPTKTYDLWKDMLKRCYSKKSHIKYPTYIGCSVSENFKSYSYFHEWCQDQIGFGKDSYALDKDLLFKENKVYSEYTCVFIPRNLNSLLIKADKIRGEYPIGVYLDKRRKTNPYVSSCSDGLGKQVHLGYYCTSREAFEVYKQYKENLIKQLAEQYKDSIDPRAYEALMNYTVEIDD